jgi:hypothetical protein
MGAVAKARRKTTKLLRRYTDLCATIDMLKQRRIALLDPTLWDDRNDSYYIRKYKGVRHAKSVLALCLTSGGETYHHWRVFCGHSSGVCVEFDRIQLLDVMKNVEGIRRGAVKYKTLGQIKDPSISLDELPFIKRWAFRDEKEYRLIYESATVEEAVYYVGIPLSAVQGIVLSPWLPPPLLKSTETLLKSIEGCQAINVKRSRLIENEDWKRSADLLTRELASSAKDETEVAP